MSPARSSLLRSPCASADDSLDLLVGDVFLIVHVEINSFVSSGLAAWLRQAGDGISCALAQSMLLRRVAKMTGGRAMTNDNDLGKIFELMVESNRGVYVLGYDLTHKMADGRWHKVRVKVTRDDLDVHAKEGYVAPKAP